MLHKSPLLVAFLAAFLMASTVLAGCQVATGLDVVNNCADRIWVSVNDTVNPLNDDDNTELLEVGDTLALAINADIPNVRIGRWFVGGDQEIFSVALTDFETESELAVVTLGGYACEPIPPE